MGEHLTHGWEPDTPVEDSVLRRFVVANASHTRALATAGGGRAQLWDDVSAADAASPIIFDNAAVLLAPPQLVDLDEVVDRLLTFYPADRHWVLLSAWPTPDLTPRGLELMGHPPLMIRPPGGAAPPLPPGLRIEQVRDVEGLADFVTVFTTVFDMDRRGLPLVDRAVLDGPFRLLVGYLDDRPVATAGTRIGYGLNDIEWVSCLAEVRGRGIGGALAWAATLAVPEYPAALIATDDGQPVYERMGYLRLMRMTMWHRPPA